MGKVLLSFPPDVRIRGVGGEVTVMEMQRAQSCILPWDLVFAWDGSNPFPSQSWVLWEGVDGDIVFSVLFSVAVVAGLAARGNTLFHHDFIQ